jgi:hypothetical protein
MKKFILILGYFLLTISCSKNSNEILISDVVNRDRYYNDEIFNNQNLAIYGRWQYLYAFGGFAGTTIEPTYDYLEFVSFGIYGRIKNDQIMDIGKVVIYTQDSIHLVIDFEPDDIYNTELLEQALIEFKGNDTLMLLDNCVDCYIHYFKRKN